MQTPPVHKPRGAHGKRPSKTITLKIGNGPKYVITDPVWENVILEGDKDPSDPNSQVQIKGTPDMTNVDCRVRLEFSGAKDGILNNIWADHAGYAVPVLESDPDMQQENNHKSMSFGNGIYLVTRLTMINNDDCIQLGKKVNFRLHNSEVHLLHPYTGDHRDTLDIDDATLVEIINCHIRGSGNSALFAKQENDQVSLDHLLVRDSLIENFKDDEPNKRQGHMVWLGYRTRVAEFTNNEFDPRPVQTLLVSESTGFTNQNNVYSMNVPKSSGVPARKMGQPIKITYHEGV